MPSKEKSNIKKSTEKTAKNKATTKDTISSKKTTTARKSTTTKKSASASKVTAATKKSASATKKNTTTKRSVSTKKATSSKKKVASTKKSTSAKVSAAKESASVVPVLVEHYDLPYRYNQTVVKVLAQTPTKLFAYWDLSDSTVNKFKEEYGDDFLDKTRPVLIVKNNTMHYSFEIEVDDFAHGWYIDVADANCDYSVELGRKPKYNAQINLPNNYVYVSSSNEMVAPNDRILFDKSPSTIYFKDVKTNIITEESILSIAFFRKLYSLYGVPENAMLSIYSKYLKLDLSNPTSGNPTSTFR